MQNRFGSRSRSEKQGRARGLGCARQTTHLVLRSNLSPGLSAALFIRREVLGLDDGDRDVVDHQMASRVNAAALEDAREDPRLIRRWLPPAESGAALLRNGGRGSFALGYVKM